MSLNSLLPVLELTPIRFAALEINAFFTSPVDGFQDHSFVESVKGHYQALCEKYEPNPTEPVPDDWKKIVKDENPLSVACETNPSVANEDWSNVNGLAREFFHIDYDRSASKFLDSVWHIFYRDTGFKDVNLVVRGYLETIVLQQMGFHGIHTPKPPRGTYPQIEKDLFPGIRLLEKFFYLRDLRIDFERLSKRVVRSLGGVYALLRNNLEPRETATRYKHPFNDSFQRAVELYEAAKAAC
jgi:hypothetical protein